MRPAPQPRGHQRGPVLSCGRILLHSFLTAGFPALEPGGLGKAAVHAASVAVLCNHLFPHSHSLTVTLRKGYLDTCEWQRAHECLYLGSNLDRVFPDYCNGLQKPPGCRPQSTLCLVTPHYDVFSSSFQCENPIMDSESWGALVRRRWWGERRSDGLFRCQAKGCLPPREKPLRGNWEKWVFVCVSVCWSCSTE